MSKIYITSDTHFAHSKNFLYEPRGFSSIEEHNAAVVANWNSQANEDDIIYHLGDVIMSDLETGFDCLRQCKGQIHIILGNHDGISKQKLYNQLPNVYLHGWVEMLQYRKYLFYLSHYPTLTSNCDADKPLRARVINLCGHSHTKDRWSDWDKGIIYHCELDAHNNKLVLLDDIIEEIKEKLNEPSNSVS